MPKTISNQVAACSSVVGFLHQGVTLVHTSNQYQESCSQWQLVKLEVGLNVRETLMEFLFLNISWLVWSGIQSDMFKGIMVRN